MNVEGALFSIGDGHCRQGEGESCEVAVESAMNSVIAIDLIKGLFTEWPRLESDDYIISTGSARPLEDAFRIAHVELVNWISTAYGLDLMDAYQLVTQPASVVANVAIRITPSSPRPRSAIYLQERLMEGPEGASRNSPRPIRMSGSSHSTPLDG